MKTTYEVYKINSKVYGISRWHQDGKATDHLAIYEARVKGVYIEYNETLNNIGVTYLLTTPVSGEAWGDSCFAEDVSDSFEELVERIKPEWLANSNKH
jgi:hypothetical protein